jgi:dienelactone hydrolase
MTGADCCEETALIPNALKVAVQSLAVQSLTLLPMATLSVVIMAVAMMSPAAFAADVQPAVRAQAGPLPAGAERVIVPALGTAPSVALPALWFPPPQDATRGPYQMPAIVLYHGCSGGFYPSGKLNARFANMAQRLTAQGYGVLIPDSFGPRGYRSICSIALSQRPIGMRERVRDAYAALHYLAARNDVDRDRIGMIGFSHGAMTVLNASDRNFSGGTPPGASQARYAGAVAFYPGCGTILRRTTEFVTQWPVLILIGEKDDWTFPQACQRLARQAAARGQPVSIVTYPGAYHGFDMTQPPTLRTDVKRSRNPEGVHVGGDPAARADAYRRVDAFFRDLIGPSAQR